MLEIILDEEVVASNNDESDIDHIFCPDCHPSGDISYCGMDISDQELLPEMEGPEFTNRDCSMCVHEWERHDCFA